MFACLGILCKQMGGLNSNKEATTFRGQKKIVLIQKEIVSAFQRDIK